MSKIFNDDETHKVIKKKKYFQHIYDFIVATTVMNKWTKKMKKINK